MKKLSSKSAVHRVLQGIWKGIQEAKRDPQVMSTYPNLDFIEKMVVELGKKAQSPDFTLSRRQVNELNNFLNSSSRVRATRGVLSTIIQKNIIKHCGGDRCESNAYNTFQFRYVVPQKARDIAEAPIRQVGQAMSSNPRDRNQVTWQKEGESWKDFQKRTEKLYLQFPGYTNYYFDPDKMLHYKIVVWSTF